MPEGSLADFNTEGVTLGSPYLIQRSTNAYIKPKSYDTYLLHCIIVGIYFVHK